MRKGARLVVATPGRLEDYLDRKLVNFRRLRMLVLDEADRMLDMGFLPAIRRIAAVLPKERQTMCFSATLEASVAHLVNDYMRNPVRLAFGSILKPSENVRVQAFEVSSDRKQEVLQRLLARETGRCLVFARTKRGTERLAMSLTREGFAAAMIHGGRSQSQRTAALAGFQQGRYRVLVATDVASRGIHVQDIAHVINYDLPEIAENFIHRVGRTGRAGSRAWLPLFSEGNSAWNWRNSSARSAFAWRGCRCKGVWPKNQRQESTLAVRGRKRTCGPESIVSPVNSCRHKWEVRRRSTKRHHAGAQGKSFPETPS